MMISTANILTVEDVLYQRLHQTADLLDVIRHRALLDAQLVRHLLLGGSIVELNTADKVKHLGRTS